MENSMSYLIKRLFEHSFKKEWYETYWAFDVHGTILIPDYRKTNKSEAEFYPYAKETLQLMSNRDDIRLIIWTSSYPEELKQYIKVFEENDIHFDYVNENPEISHTKGSFGFYEKKFYFNLLFEDKAGFVPELHWKGVYETMKEYENNLPDPKWSMKYIEKYHKKD